MQRRLWVMLGVVLLAACGSGHARTAASSSPAPSTTTTTSTSVPTTTISTTTTSTTTTTTAPPATTVPAAVPDRHVSEQPWAPFAVGGDVTLHYPSSRVEHVGFHQSNDEGSQHLEALPGVDATTLEDRGRNTDRQGSADVVVDPDSEIRAPVSGTVISSGRYVLYCDMYDYFINIEPDDHPGWKVRILHLTDLDVAEGDRVEAGVTVVAPHARQLPFASQVDDIRTADPPWPHVHLEVVDPNVPNVPNPGSGSEDCS
jgi:murein DD-endopeptidase MepM/ murein hydrolase activator NlpD